MMKYLILLSLLVLSSCGKHELIKGAGSGDQIEVSNELNSDPLIIATTNGNFSECWLQVRIQILSTKGDVHY
jgi:hypothetical protein